MKPLLLAFTFFSCSCSTLRFYSQAASGQIQMLSRARPVGQLLADPKVKPHLKQKLTTVADILHFAETTLQLPAKGQYCGYTDLRRAHAVWVVFAAPEFSTQPKKWRYPLVGQLAYRGFFKAAEAQQEAAKLQAQGYDVFVAGVDAYSTLGFFRDPLLSTFIGRDDADLAELIFHELTHQRLYLQGDTHFNEAYATASGQEGARRWLHARGRLKELSQYERELKAERDFTTLALQTRAELEALYQSQPTTLNSEQRQQQKAGVFARFHQRAISQDHRKTSSMQIDRWFKKPVNNARLASLSAYYDLVPGFEVLLKQQSGDLEKFHAQVLSMKSLTPIERQQKLGK